MKPKIKLEVLAAMCHAANREYCKGFGEHDLHEHWDECTQEEKNISLNAMRDLFKAFDFEYVTIDSIAEATWQAWKKAKAAEGWIYGSVKNKELKTHPCLVANYHEISGYEKAKDQIYLSLMQMIARNCEIEL